MKTAIRLISFIALIYSIYAIWAHNKWNSADNQTGVMENCRWKTNEGINKYDCLIRLSDGELASLHNFVLDDENHKKVTVKVEVNKLRKKRKRYTFISSS